MFGGLFKIEKIEPGVYDTYGYKLTLMEDYQGYIKRLIIKIDEPTIGQIYTRLNKNVQEKLNPEIYEALKPLQ